MHAMHPGAHPCQRGNDLAFQRGQVARVDDGWVQLPENFE